MKTLALCTSSTPLCLLPSPVQASSFPGHQLLDICTNKGAVPQYLSEKGSTDPVMLSRISQQSRSPGRSRVMRQSTQEGSQDQSTSPIAQAKKQSLALNALPDQWVGGWGPKRGRSGQLEPAGMHQALTRSQWDPGSQCAKHYPWGWLTVLCYLWTGLPAPLAAFRAESQSDVWILMSPVNLREQLLLIY